MGITVISTAPAALAAAGAPNAGAAGGLAGSGLGGSGFAALLSGQLGTALGLDAAPPEASADDEDAPSIAVDPSLAFLLGNPAITPPLQPNLAATQLGNSLDKDLLGEKGSSAAGLTELLQSAGGKGESPTEAGKLMLGAAAEAPFGLAAGKELPAETANIAVDTQSNASASASAASLLAAGNRAAGANAGVQPRSEIATPLHAANWASDFGEKVVWLAKSEQQSAQLNINPAQLGPVQITLQLNGDQATAVFASPHAEVRQAIEDSLPQLREMLAGAGINLGQADIGANLARQQADGQFKAAAENRSSGENAILPAVGGTGETAAGQPIQRGRGLVDLFA